MKMLSTSLSLCVFCVLIVIPGGASAGRNLKSAEYHVGLAERYVKEGTCSILPSVIESAEMYLGQASE